MKFSKSAKNIAVLKNHFTNDSSMTHGEATLTSASHIKEAEET